MNVFKLLEELNLSNEEKNKIKDVKVISVDDICEIKVKHQTMSSPCSLKFENNEIPCECYSESNNNECNNSQDVTNVEIISKGDTSVQSTSCVDLETKNEKSNVLRTGNMRKSTEAGKVSCRNFIS